VGVVDDAPLDFLFPNHAIREDVGVMLADEGSDRLVVSEEVHELIQGNGRNDLLKNFEFAILVQNIEDRLDTPEGPEVEVPQEDVYLLGSLRRKVVGSHDCVRK